MRMVSFSALVLAAAMAVSPGPASAKIYTPGITGAFIASGGGAGGFSTVRAFDSMLGEPAFTNEIAALHNRFGPDRFGSEPVDRFIRVFDYAMDDAWKHAGEDNISVAHNQSLHGRALAHALVARGTSGRKFTTIRLLIALFTGRVAGQVEGDIQVKYGNDELASFNTISDAMFSDIGTLLSGS